MKLTSSASTNYFKFQNIGDRIQGTFVGYTERVPGRFGPEDQLVLETADGPTQIRCPASLARTIRENAHRLPGRQLTVTFVSEKPTTKGSNMKVFDVELDDDGRPTASSAEDNIPF